MVVLFKIFATLALLNAVTTAIAVALHPVEMALRGFTPETTALYAGLYLLMTLVCAGTAAILARLKAIGARLDALTSLASRRGLGHEN